MIDELQKLVPWLSGLPMTPKIFLSFAIASASTFVLALIWSGEPSAGVAEGKEYGTVHKYEVEITSPPNGAKVRERPLVAGRVVEPSARISLVVHPVETEDYWVQPKVDMLTPTTWQVRIHIGRSGAVDLGKEFEIRAIGNPKSELKEGDIIDSWPEGEWQSPVVNVIRN